MVVGVIAWELEVYGCQSLKEKRAVLRSLKDRLHARFNLSVAETGYQDLWQRAELTACVAAGGRRQADSILESADRVVSAEARVRIMHSSRVFY
ncbi:MAG: DUF503 domain-containing protein [Gemmatimonadetes bacterium]|nr:DUF503 domain-containing protein [Gemmatimonadota bacterium]